MANRNRWQFEKLFLLEDRLAPAASPWDVPGPVASAASIEAGATSYRADGHVIELTPRSDRVAVGLSNPASLDKVLAATGLSLVRWLGGRGAVIEGPNAASILNHPPAEVAYAVPVFVNGFGKLDAVALDEVTIALDPAVNAAEFFRDSRFAGYRPLWGTTDQFVATVRDGPGLPAIALANSLSNDPRVRWSEPNLYQDWRKQFDPNDALYGAGDLWGVKNVGQYGGLADADTDTDLAWDLNPGGSPNRIIAVVDDGLETTHPDLNPWINPGEIAGNLVDDDNNGYIDDVNGWDFFADNNQMLTSAADRHGTAVAGVAAARGNNGVGVAGPSYNAKILTARIFHGTSSADDATIASAVYYAAGRNKSGVGSFASVDVMNNSWGGGGYVSALTAAFQCATSAGRGGLGTVTVAATGNGYAGNLLYPALLSQTNPGLIAVGGVNNKGTRSDYSNFGTGLDLVAPTGDQRAGYLGIATTDRLGGAGYNVGDYTGILTGIFSGTSAAAPHAAGIAGLVLSQAEAKGVALTAAQVRALLKNGTDLTGGASYDPATGDTLEFGRGRINAFTSVDGVGKPELSVLSATADMTSGATVAFGNAFVGFSSTKTIRIRNAGTNDLTLGSLTITGGSAFSIDAGFGATTLKLGEATTFTVRFAPIGVGPANGSLSFTSNDANESTFTLTFTGSGVGSNVSGRVFEDWNGNGVADANDPGLAGRTVYLDTNGNGLLDRATYTVNANQAIPDGNANGIASTVNVSGLNFPLSGLTVTVNLAHPTAGDISLYLVSPAGTATMLASAVGEDGDNFVNTIFDDAAVLPVTRGIAPFTGNFQPQFNALGNFTGENPNGTWTFFARDTIGGGEVGTLLNWSIAFNAEPVAVTDSQGQYAFGGVANGAYTVRTLTPAGWSATSGASGYPVTIAAPGDSFPSREFGSAKNDRAYLRVRDDQNANGTFEGGEPFVAGRTVFRDANGNGTIDVAGPPAVVTKNTSQGIPDANPTGATSTVIVSGLTGTILDLDVTLNATHTAVGDLRFQLVSPMGTTITLVDQRGSIGVNFAGTIFDDAATVPAANMLAWQSPHTTRYIPETALAAVNGQNPNGTWTLHGYDLGGNGVGSFGNWTLTITTAKSEAASVSDSIGNAFLDLPAGSNTIRLASLAGWKFTNPADGKLIINASGVPLYEATFGVAEAVAPAVSSPIIVNDGSLQRSRVTSLRIDFSERILVSGPAVNAFTLSGPGGAVPFIVTIDDSGPATAVTIDFTPLADGVYFLAVNAALIADVAQNGLSPLAPFQFHRLFGDTNGDGTTDSFDFVTFGNAFNVSSGDPGYQLPLDINLDGIVDALDFVEFGGRFNRTV